MPPARPDSPVGSVVGQAGRLAGPPRRAFSGSSGSSALAESPEALHRAEALPLPGTRENDSPESRERPSGGALEALLADLGSQIQRGTSREVAEPLRFFSTGIPELDALLGGGFPCGRISEICGPGSSGRTALAQGLIRAALSTPGSAPEGAGDSVASFVSWVDPGDAFDPQSAVDAGIDLERILWIRPHSSQDALRSCDRLLQTEGFGLVLLDTIPAAVAPPRPPAPRMPEASNTARSTRKNGRASGARTPVRDADWLRLARLAAKTRTALIVLSEGQHPSTGSRADVVLEMLPASAHFGTPFGARAHERSRPAKPLLESVETQTVLRRHRSKPSGVRVPLLLKTHAPKNTALSESC